MRMDSVGTMLGRLVAVLLLCGAAPCGADTLFDSDFGQADVALKETGGKVGGGVSGVLPPGWKEDFTGWTDVKATCDTDEQDGQRYLQINVLEGKNGTATFCFAPLPPTGKGEYYRLRMRLRSPSSSVITYGMRMAGSPYRFLWQDSRRLASTWRDIEQEFQTAAPGQAIGFWFSVNAGAAMVDIAKITLEKVDKAALVKEREAGLLKKLAREYPDGPPANVLRDTRFPLGLQAGWMLFRDFSDGDDVLIKTDMATPGPSGFPALRIKAAEPMWLRGPPIGIVNPMAKHCYSLSIKGEGKWRFSVVAGKGNEVAGETVELKGGKNWERVRLSFMPDLMEKLYCPQIAGSGTLWLDALQCGPADKVKDYASAYPCEVALSCPESDASVGDIQFDDEAPLTGYCVSGDARGAELKAKVVNLYGEERELPSAPLAGAETLKYGELAYDVFPGRRFGTFRVEAWVEKAGKRISPVNEIILHRLRRPRHWGEDAPESPFGAHMTPVNRHVVMAKAAGVNWTRLHDAGQQSVGWSWLEPEKGKWQFRDKDIFRYRERHIKIFAGLNTAPPWASHASHEKRFADRSYQPLNMEDFKNYVRVLALRYRGVIGDYYVWNEPWCHGAWAVKFDEATGLSQTSAEARRDFANLQRAAYDTVKAVDPAIQLSGLNTYNGVGGPTRFNGRDWTAGVVAAGGDVSCDMMDYHSYTSEPGGYPDDQLDRGMDVAFGPVKEKHGGKLPKPIWMSEGSNTLGMIREGFYKHTLPYERSDLPWESSDRTCRYTLGLLKAGVAKVFLYSLHCAGGFGGGNGYNVLVAEDGSFHPSATAYSNLTWHLEDTKYARHISPAAGVHVYLFEGKNRAVAVISSEPNYASYAIPGEAVDLFGNPVKTGEKFTGHLVYVAAEGSADKLAGMFAKIKERP